MYKTQRKEVLEARPYGTKFAQDIGAVANSNWEAGAQMAVLIGSLALQTLLVSVAVTEHQPGSDSGKEFLKNCYDAIVKDALERWDEEDLKAHFGNKNGRSS